MNVLRACQRVIGSAAFAITVACSWLLLAADSPEAEQAFKVAALAFQDEAWERAEREFGEFAARFPDSPRVLEVVLLQAQSRFQLKRFDAVLELMPSRLGRAGTLADQYRFWIAEAQFARGNFAAAAEAYAELLKQFPESNQRLAASHGEAFARFKLGDPARAAELLRKPDGTFQQAAQKQPDHEITARGHLLLAEALHAQKNNAAAAAVLETLGQRALKPELDWQRQYLLAMVEIADQRSDAALSRTTNLLSAATQAQQPLLAAKSLKLQAEILERDRPEEAIQAYERLAALAGLPRDQTRQAVLKSVDLTIARGRLTNAIQRLENYLAVTNLPPDPAQDLMRLTLGELHLKRFHQFSRDATNMTGTAEATNALHLARAQFDLLINVFTNSPLVGKAYLNRGWCLWEQAQETGDEARLTDCLVAFQTATQRLPKSEDQAVARFKWADCQFLLRNYTNAIQNHRELLTAYADSPAVKSRLFDQSLSQVLRASIEIGEFEGARAALDRLLVEFPQSPLADRGVVHFGQALLEAGRPSEARTAFANFEKRFPNSTLRAEAELGLARSFAGDGQWPEAIARYDHWVATFTNHPARAQTEFDRALAYARSGRETNAMALLTNVVVQFPASPVAPLAQLWVGDFHFSRGAYVAAEESYQSRIFTQAAGPSSLELAYQARYMAGRAAFARQGYADARRYVTNLIADPNVPSALLPLAFYSLGEIELMEAAQPNTNTLERISQAARAFGRVPKGHWLEPLARGHVGNCYLQLATTDPRLYDRAIEEYTQVLDLPAASVTARGTAEMGLAAVLEKQAQDANRPDAEQRKLLQRALDHCLNVVYGKRLRPEQGEEPDAYWLGRAGLKAGELAERLGLFGDAERIYARLVSDVPFLRETWERKLEALRQRVRPSPSG